MRLLMRCIISETGPGKGISLEKSTGPVVYLNTTAAFRAPPGNNLPPRHVTLHLGGPQDLPFAVVLATDPNAQSPVASDNSIKPHHFVMRACTPTGEPGSLMMQLNFAAGHLNVLNASGTLVATCEQIYDQAKHDCYHAIRIGYGECFGL